MADVQKCAYIPNVVQDHPNKLNIVFFALLQPLARIFLRFGRGYREFSELSKAAFVAVAAEDYGVHGRPTNVSRIAAMTGLTRKEVSRIRNRIEERKAVVTDRGTPLQEVISAWRMSDEFRGENGEAAVLPLTGKRGSFQSLVRQFAGDIPEGAMRKELQRIGAAYISDDAIELCPKRPGIDEAEAELARKLRAGPYEVLVALAQYAAEQNGNDCRPFESAERGHHSAN
ncbi:MAG: DUF6502 family protein [Gammaproteobacteria bacterium]|nr:DUF6502 family protein [Gammaproteobacteria bacterium]MDH3362836.1 DUF6502 family protein [Gammaproteobacteria bacterium]MDH3480241.1 DUF6502 family protein [Gammaproteobacteria bacterium]